MKTTYLIDRPDSHGRMRILARDDFDFKASAIEDYRIRPNYWSEVGLADNEGRLIFLQAPSDAYAVLQGEYLAPGNTHTFEITEAESEAMKLRDMLQRIVDDAFELPEAQHAVSSSLIAEANNLLHPD